MATGAGCDAASASDVGCGAALAVADSVAAGAGCDTASASDAAAGCSAEASAISVTSYGAETCVTLRASSVAIVWCSLSVGRVFAANLFS